MEKGGFKTNIIDKIGQANMSKIDQSFKNIVNPPNKLSMKKVQK